MRNLSVVLGAVFTASLAMAQTPTVLHSGYSNAVQGTGPLFFASDGTRAYFRGNTGPASDELFVTDGTANGTFMLRDICPGNCGSNLSKGVILGSKYIFSANDGYHGDELWISDGTTAGTQLLKDIQLGNGASQPGSFLVFNNAVYFAAQDNGNGRELWKTDGTAAGTVMLADLNAGGNASSPLNLVQMGSAFYFSAFDSFGRELWKSDGTAAGTVRITNLNPTGDGLFNQLFSTGTRLYFPGTDGNNGIELYWSDGVTAGLTSDLALGSASALATGTAMAQLGSDIIFSATLLGDSELYRSNGTGAATRIADINLTGSSLINNLTTFGNEVYFVAQDTTANAVELWKTNGSTATLVQNINTNTNQGSNPSFLTVTTNPNGNELLFAATSGSIGTELYKVTATGAVQLVKDIIPGVNSSFPQNFIAFGTGVLFGANANEGHEVHFSDGTTTGTAQVVNLRAEKSWNSSVSTAAWDAGVVFSGSSQNEGFEPWISDGTTGGTRLFYDLLGGGGGSSPGNFISLGSHVFMTSGNSAGLGNEPVVTNGTIAGTTVFDLNPGGNGSNPNGITSAGDRVFFTAFEPTVGTELGVASVTGASLIDLATGTANSNINNLTGLNGKAVFVYAPGNDSELWVTDGTAANTQRLVDIRPGLVGSGPGNFRRAGNRVFFSANDGLNGNELWVTDGTATGTRMVADIMQGAGNSNPNTLVAVEDVVFFFANTGPNEIWRSDGTAAGTFRVPGAVSRNNEVLTLIGGGDGLLYFVRTTTETVRELYCTDGYTTRLIASYAPGFQNLFGLTGFHPGPGYPYLFAAADGTGSLELYSSLGTAATTGLVAEIGIGVEPGNPRGFTVWNDKLFFLADTSSNQTSLAMLPLSALDKSPPTVSSNVTGTVFTGSNPPVYTSDVTVNWITTDAQSQTSACPSVTVNTDTAGTTLTCTTTSVGGSATGTVTVIRDATAPTITCPANSTIEAMSPTGAIPPPFPVLATDTVDLSPTVSVSPGIAIPIPLGKTTFTGTATDDYGHSSTCTYDVTVVDSTAPAVTCPANLTLEATGSTGAMATFSATATDVVDTTPTVTLNPASGGVFALGTTPVTATATDDSTNSSNCAFNVVVRDTTDPSVFCPGSVNVEATSSNGATVSWNPATATDVVDTAPVISYSADAGSLFPLGNNTVNVTARDSSGNLDNCSFLVTVRDTVGPSLVCPSSMVVEAASASGAVVNFSDASATDTVGGAVTLAYAPAKGSTFALGDTTVVATGTDARGNAAACSFNVHVRDTTPPVVTCPANVAADSPTGGAIAVTYAAATANDSVDPSPELFYSQASGSLFYPGVSKVFVLATDNAGRSGNCTFDVTVTVPDNGTGGGAGGGTGGAGGGAGGGTGGAGGGAGGGAEENPEAPASGCGCSSGVELAPFALLGLGLALRRRRQLV